MRIATMRTRSPIAIVVVLLAAVAAVPGTRDVRAAPPTAPAANGASFAEAVDLEAFGRLAVYTEGRVKSFDSFATAAMKIVAGHKGVNEQTPSFTYLDMMLRPRDYVERPVVLVKNKLVRARLARALEAEGLTRGAVVEFIKTGRVSPALLVRPGVRAALDDLGTDVLRTAKFVERTRAALSVMNPESLAFGLRMIPPPGGGFEERWHALDEVFRTEGTELASLPPEVVDGIGRAWSDFQTGWTREDAAAVNDAAARLADLLPRVNDDPAIYPATSRLGWESWYFRSYNMTWVWIIYAFALVPLLLYVVFRWPAAMWLGMLLFLVAFGFHTFSLALRWYISGRWPNSNMFEAVTTAAWFGGAFAVLFEMFAWRWPVRGLVALGSAAASMVALMAAYYWPAQLDPSISNMMPVLHDVWLYIHTNVIIFSYCLIAMAAASALLYVGARLIKAIRGESGSGDYARVGGAGSLIMTTPDGGSYLERAKTSTAQVLDGTTMILLEMAFVFLWTGLVMGAIWADHSWGRPWGWDPKEVFALNTFLIFAVLVHVRLKTRDKGLWTAILALIGCAVMIFNWVVINFTIAGLHSYA